MNQSNTIAEIDIFAAVSRTPLILILVIASMIISAAFLLRISEKYKTLSVSSNAKFQTLEGLRGILAMCVFSGHCVISLGYMHNAKWESPDYVLYTWATKGAVAMFFMITGLLFWNKTLNSGCEYKSHFKSRFKRIYPLYLFMAGIVFVIALFQSSFKLNVSMAQLLKEVVFWLLPGITDINSLNGTAILFINAGVLWTLQYEWAFYFILPIISFLFRNHTWSMLGGYAIIYLVAYRLGLSDMVTYMKVALPILLGCLTAKILLNDFHQLAWQKVQYHWITLFLVVTSISLYFPGLSTLINTVLLWPAFILIAGGISVFGFLNYKPIVYLGRISFGVYLLHGIFLYFLRALLVNSVLDQFLQDIIFVAAIAPMAFLVTLICTWVHFWIEMPFMKRGTSNLQLKAAQVGGTS